MCGIVGYFGSAPNGLARVLTAMEAIIYRAPDSTGIGVFGCENSPLRTRKTVGSVVQLADLLLQKPLYPNEPQELMGLFDSAGDNANLENRQRWLLNYEKLPDTYMSGLEDGYFSYPFFAELIDDKNPQAPRIVPGWPGRPHPITVPHVNSSHDLKKAIRELVDRYDISPVVIKAMFKDALLRLAKKRGNEGYLEIDPETLPVLFDQVFDDCLDEDGVPKAPEFEKENFWHNQKAFELVWRFLGSCRVTVPSDYDNDGVRGLFRLLDAALMCRLPSNPRLVEELQRRFENLWAGAADASMDWKTLYMAEKGVNVYGYAAAAATIYLEKEYSEKIEKPDDAIEDSLMGMYVLPGRTDPAVLSRLLPPILSQGRWALQSAVTAENGHPFFDNARQRMIVLNGQFNSSLENDVRSFLTDVACFRLRSENSSEYYAMLWGYFFDRLRQEQKRYGSITSQLQKGLESYDIGSQSVDYKIFHKIQGKSEEQIDEIAFVEAARRMIRGGGQIAVAGASVVSPSKIFLVCHNRPVFIVRRIETGDVMVVSDVNAAMGLFSQKKIATVARELETLRAGYRKFFEDPSAMRATGEIAEAELAKFKRRENQLLNTFQVQVFPLDGEEIFARIQIREKKEGPVKAIDIMDFKGNPIPEIEPFETILSPPQMQKDFYNSFFETHLHEIPCRMEDILAFYVPDKDAPPRFKLRTGVLQRRFGHDFERLERVVLIGIGSSHNMNSAARRFIEAAVPVIEAVALKPVEVENVLKLISPQKDLVVLTSWSGTSAEIVQLANLLHRHDIPFVAVTEKVFSDLGLIGGKSAGVVSTLSGEEVTVSGIKSTLCTLQCLCLLGVWLCHRLHCKKKAKELQKLLHDIPDVLKGLLEDWEVKNFCEEVAWQSAYGSASFVIDALDSTGVGVEAAMKLAETSWSSAGKPLDYDDFYLQCLKKHPDSNLILVHATCKPRLDEALEIMKRLFLEKTPFAAVTTSIREMASVETFCGNRCVSIPEVDPVLQFFVDCAFYYLFSFYFGKARGRAADFPRNRAKSVTAARELFEKPLSPAAEIHLIDYESRGIDLERLAPEKWPQRKTLWERTSDKYWEKLFYQTIRELVKIASAENSLDSLIEASQGANPRTALSRMAEALEEEMDIVFVPLDRPARAAAKNLAVQFNRLLPNCFRTASPRELSDRFPTHSFTVVLDSKSHDRKSPLTMGLEIPGGCVYVGPAFDARAFGDSMESCFLKNPTSFAGSDLLYFTVCLMLLDAMEKIAPKRARIVKRFFKKGCLFLNSILESADLKGSIEYAAGANSSYETALFIGPPGGVGELWTDRFDQYSSMILQDYYFGESAHGPLVTIDPKVDEKYVRLEPGNAMIQKYDKDQIAEWESRYLGGRSTDVFLNQSSDYLTYSSETPFFASGHWYFPVLRQDYDTTEDNLVIVDATSRRGLARAQDDLSTFGARHARMLVISQKAFPSCCEQICFFKFPISHMVELPPMFETKDAAEPFTGLLLPVAMSCVAMAAAAAMKKESPALTKS